MTNLIELEKPQEWHSEYDGSKKTGTIFKALWQVKLRGLILPRVL